jgi:hypothetical protein
VTLEEKKLKKHLKCYYGYVKLSWALNCSWEQSTSVKAFCKPPPSSLVLKVFKMPHWELEPFPKNNIYF